MPFIYLPLVLACLLFLFSVNSVFSVARTFFSKRRMDGHEGKDVHAVGFSFGPFPLDHPDH
jgi:hypothetical protein